MMMKSAVVWFLTRPVHTPKIKFFSYRRFFLSVTVMVVVLPALLQKSKTTQIIAKVSDWIVVVVFVLQLRTPLF